LASCYDAAVEDGSSRCGYTFPVSADSVLHQSICDLIQLVSFYQLVIINCHNHRVLWNRVKLAKEMVVAEIVPLHAVHSEGGTY